MEPVGGWVGWGEKSIAHCLLVAAQLLPSLHHDPSIFSGSQVHALSCAGLVAVTWTVAHQAPLSMEFFRQECWSGLPFPPPGDLPDPGIKSASLAPPALPGGFTTPAPPGKSSLDPRLHLGRTLDWLRQYEVHLDPWMEQIGPEFQRKTNHSQKRTFIPSFPDFTALPGALDISLYKNLQNKCISESGGREPTHCTSRKRYCQCLSGPGHPSYCRINPSYCVSFQECTMLPFSFLSAQDQKARWILPR